MAHDDDFLDELASAYLDGEVTPEERAQVEADPELLARVERLRGVRVLLAGDVDLLDSSGFDEMRLRALAALDEEPVEAGVPAAAAATSLDAARQRRASRIWKPLAAVAGAAAIGVAAISGVANLSADDNSSDQSTTASEETFAASAEAATAADDEAAKEAAGGGSAADSAAPAETIGEIGGGADVEGGSPLAADTGAAEISAAAPAGAPETTAAAAEEAATPPQSTIITARVALSTEDEVVAVAADARNQLAAGMSPAPSSSECPELGLRWDVVVWRGTPADLYLDVEPGASDADVAIVATEDCTVLLSVTLP